MSIQVKRLTKIYGQQKAVNNISFSVNKGEIVGFLGPNGAGKSTTMKIITGYLKQDDGEVKVCDMDVAINPMEIKEKIGYLPEANPLYQDMYVKEYLGFIASVHKMEVKKQKIQAVIEQVGLAPEAHKKIGQLSKGYKQRVGLAAALIHDPEVLILDEPSSGLDPNQIVEIREVIKEQGKNKTVLFSSHILQEVQAVCDRVVIINKGAIIADDKLSDLLKNTSGSEVVMQIKEEVEASMFDALQTVIRVNTNTWSFKTDNPDQLRKLLLEIALRNNLNIVSLQSGNQNLETIFRELTTAPVEEK